MTTLYSIGEFSKVTGLSPKTLRFYHERGLLVPTSIDESTGYRFYDSSKIEKARIIMRLRAMELSVEDVAAILMGCNDESDVLNYLDRQKAMLQERIANDRDIVRTLNEIISREREAQTVLRESSFSVVEKNLEPGLVAGIRMKGKYSDCGRGFSTLSKTIGRHIGGPPLCLYHDGEYREDDADFEPCFPIRKEITAPGIAIHHLAGGKCLSLIHRGPYDQLGRSYARILSAVKDRAVNIQLPTREVYLKGPGMIFKGNPRNYLTEILLPLATP